MDNQQLFNLVVSVAGFLASFVFYQVMQRLQKLEDQVSVFKESMPKEYVQKDDYKSDIKEIKDILRQIFEKLDNKADK
jgi:tetrahydromethanopterin S-methyltransferase subunit G